ncbi:methyltransferase domain-containing protein [Glutamicibacter sp. M10]|uniref:methyltransferase domain-containing protein n=1 Tax=Glutamicibacter sp. M10 TaxID=3023076 RepID=UPI0029055CE2|nr:methyltransferase domain-containing protein [Glutamicibacter sp. M10]
MKWDPAKYTEFSDYRGRPYKDLLGQLTEIEPKNIVDLGCGPGNMTRLLAQRWPDAQVTGLDSSAEMIAKAKSSEHEPNLDFALADATTWRPAENLDLLFSNAMLQWLPNHRELLSSWLGTMKPGAYVAIQMPGNFRSPSHALMREVAESPKWIQKLGEYYATATLWENQRSISGYCCSKDSKQMSGRQHSSNCCPAMTPLWIGFAVRHYCR